MFCQQCGTETQSHGGAFCRYCGARFDDEDRFDDRPQYLPEKNLSLAGFLSLIIPGAGQAYLGRSGGSPILWFVAVIVGYVCLIVPGVVLHLCCIANAMSREKYRPGSLMGSEEEARIRAQFTRS